MLGCLHAARKEEARRAAAARTQGSNSACVASVLIPICPPASGIGTISPPNKRIGRKRRPSAVLLPGITRPDRRLVSLMDDVGKDIVRLRPGFRAGLFGLLAGHSRVATGGYLWTEWSIIDRLRSTHPAILHSAHLSHSEEPAARSSLHQLHTPDISTPILRLSLNSEEKRPPQPEGYRGLMPW